MLYAFDFSKAIPNDCDVNWPLIGHHLPWGSARHHPLAFLDAVSACTFIVHTRSRFSCLENDITTETGYFHTGGHILLVAVAAAHFYFYL